jgi:hypothetical protein
MFCDYSGFHCLLPTSIFTNWKLAMETQVVWYDGTKDFDGSGLFSKMTNIF